MIKKKLWNWNGNKLIFCLFVNIIKNNIVKFLTSVSFLSSWKQIAKNQKKIFCFSYLMLLSGTKDKTSPVSYNIVMRKGNNISTTKNENDERCYYNISLNEVKPNDFTTSL